MKWVANSISIARMCLALLLLLTKPLHMAFFAVYLVCGLSDVLDGYIARKTGTTSKLGEKLDSIADFTLIVVLMIALYPVMSPTVPILVWIGIIAIVRVVSIVIGFVKYQTLAMLHTYGNKITGLALFVFLPLMLLFVKSDVLQYIICAVASLATIEELLIHLTTNELQINRKSILFR